MVLPPSRPAPTPIGPPVSRRLNSWKEIAAYLDTSVRTVQRWEEGERLPVHRHEHAKVGTVYAHTSEIDAWLASRRGVQAVPPRAAPRWPRYAVPAVLFVVVIGALGAWFWGRDSRVRWAREVALLEIPRLLDASEFYAAFRLARQARKYIPTDPRLQELWRDVSIDTSVVTDPPGAKVYIRDQFAPGDAPGWELVGTSPLERVRLPCAFVRWRVAKEGYETSESASFHTADSASFKLYARGACPPGMVLVPGGTYRYASLPAVSLEDYWLDKYEVTNRQFKEFIDAGGYRERRFWKHPFLRDSEVLTWEQAMATFRDTTGRPGPSTWELGSYPKGQVDFPVGGVSWYEAAAYAEFAGKSLPTIYHWRKAAGSTTQAFETVRFCNFGPAGPAQVGSDQRSLGLFGVYDMAGNVKEWCWNQSRDLRHIPGGAWGEPNYTFYVANAMPPMDRSATHGFRCAKYTAPLPETLTGPVDSPFRDYSKEKPVSEEVFQAYKRTYAYDRGELKAAIQAVDDSSEHWRREKIAFNAAYGNERVMAHLFLPRNASPPYQTVIFFPGGGALYLSSSNDLYLRLDPMDFVVRSGRALLHPIYKGTYERRIRGAWGSLTMRDLAIQWSKDLGRSIDYLETRPDIDSSKLAYYGLSLGAEWGPTLTAVEGRFKTSILLAGGLWFWRRPPESEGINFAPRARMPVLMLNGRNDFHFPLETSQRPLFRLLGAPDKDKRHVTFDSGHVPPRQAVIKEILDWLDRYLGPVQPK